MESISITVMTNVDKAVTNTQIESTCTKEKWVWGGNAVRYQREIVMTNESKAVESIRTEDAKRKEREIQEERGIAYDGGRKIKEDG